ncbi:MAG: hypothetical protein JSS02_09690 [Planctomycetes bacterium]|nr:hypothetical protein [Planctomycetota bacterium]
MITPSPTGGADASPASYGRLPSPTLEQRIAAAPIPAEPAKVGDWLFLATLNESLIDKEWKLAGDRAGLMMSAQAFLFGAFFLILFNKEKNVDAARLLLTVIPIVGAVIIAFSSCGIFIAVAVARRLEEERSYYQGVLSRMFKISIPDLGVRRSANRALSWSRPLGLMPFIVISLILFVLWGIVLLSRLTILLTIKAID